MCKPIEQAKTADLARTPPALRRARKRAEQIAAEREHARPLTVLMLGATTLNA